MRKWKKKKVVLNNPAEKIPIKIVSDASIATQGVGDGRMIPLVIIDTTTRPDIEELIKAHNYLAMGEMESGWAKPEKNKDKLRLILTFNRPSRCVVIIDFDITKQGIIIDQVVNSQALYIQPGRVGDRLQTTMDNPKILVEIPSHDFKEEWNILFLSRVVKDLEKKGLKKQNAKEAGKKLIEELRKIGNLRMKSI